jgi:hypothetical protein
MNTTSPEGADHENEFARQPQSQPLMPPSETTAPEAIGRHRWWIQYVILTGIVILTTSVFYFSWLPQPRLGTQVSMPGFLARWVDAEANENIRTAVPFALLGLTSGAGLWFRGARLRLWVFSGLLMVMIACVAELGQRFIPERTCDAGDIGWAAVGAGLGLGVTLATCHICRLARARRRAHAPPT